MMEHEKREIAWKITQGSTPESVLPVCSAYELNGQQYLLDATSRGA